MSRVVDGLQGEYREEEEDPAQGHGHDHGRGQQVHPFWSEEVQEEHLLAQARPRGLPDETLSENLLELDLDEDELRTAGESTPPKWPTGVATRGTSRSSSDGVSRDSRLQSLLEADMAEGGTGVRQRGASMGLLGLQGHAGQGRGLGQVQGSKVEQLARWTSSPRRKGTGSWTRSRL